MSKNIIHLLPDSVCNQIAAGEVIHRPASVVKELLDNSVDAQSTKITLVLEDNGNSLIQVIDNGIGMSDVDLRMSLEKHATSKIKSGDDLFNIMTMGFRGEAIASIVSVAQVEIISCQNENELGSKLVVEGSIVKSQEPVAAVVGTIFSVKNLFYNIPVRRNFLKSPKSEMRHIVDEFIQSALSQPHIEYNLIHNGEQIYKWPATKLYNRIIDIFGEGYKKKLIQCFENSEFANLDGYVCDPSCVRKARDYQFLFVNNRYIKNHILQKAIFDAYAKIIPPDKFPCYVIFLTIPPTEVDVNIHPSKIEVRFHNEELIFAMLKSIVMKCLYKYDTSEIDFNSENTFFTAEKNFFARDVFNEEMEQNKNFIQSGDGLAPQQKIFSSKLKDLYQEPLSCGDDFSSAMREDNKIQIPPFIITTVKSGLILIHQDRAEERIFYERNVKNIKENKMISQQLLFQQKIQLLQSDFEIAQENKKIFTKLGFNLDFEKNCQAVIFGYPNFLNENKIVNAFEEILEKIKSSDVENNFDHYIKIFTKKINHNYSLTPAEIDSLVNQLFTCSDSKFSPNGEPIFKILNLETLNNLL
ncbi:MAG: DNA mismatch repair endonuclease MutL [Cytophagales bacterium]|jgi:DNA mismatch repair protein MutL|nr:DNA mismatch repair endonuclease MutL [Cytophagales bacterium]